MSGYTCGVVDGAHACVAPLADAGDGGPPVVDSGALPPVSPSDAGDAGSPLPDSSADAGDAAVDGGP